MRRELGKSLAQCAKVLAAYGIGVVEFANSVFTLLQNVFTQALKCDLSHIKKSCFWHFCMGWRPKGRVRFS